MEFVSTMEFLASSKVGQVIAVLFPLRRQIGDQSAKNTFKFSANFFFVKTPFAIPPVLLSFRLEAFENFFFFALNPDGNSAITMTTTTLCLLLPICWPEQAR